MTVEKKPLPTELIDALLADYKKPEDSIGQDGILRQLTKALAERALQAEMTDHLGYGKNQVVANEAGNTRNGHSKKTLTGDFGDLPIEIPRDRAGTFEPQIITKHQTRWSGFDDKILSLYARCMSVREICLTAKAQSLLPRWLAPLQCSHLGCERLEFQEHCPQASPPQGRAQ